VTTNLDVLETLRNRQMVTTDHQQKVTSGLLHCAIPSDLGRPSRSFEL